MAIAGDERLVVLERDLVLAEVALALGALDLETGPGHAQADTAQQRLDARPAQDRVIDVVEVRWRQVAISGLPGLLVTIEEDDELQLRADECRHAGIGQPVDLAAQHLARRCGDIGSVLPEHVAEHADSAVLPRDSVQGGQVRAHDHVAVAGVPG